MREIQSTILINLNLFLSNTLLTITISWSHLLLEYYYNTSGANETILVKFNCLNSRAIAPKTRVPFGFPS